MSIVVTRHSVRRAAAAALLLSLVSLGACSSSDDDGESAATPAVEQDAATAAGGAAAGDAAAADVAAGKAAAQEALKVGATVIDVRTPEEFAEGHVDGATLVNFRDVGFVDAVGKLDPSVTYVVYCRSGNRSAQAAEVMRDAGLTVLDGGALDDMAAAGWATV